PQPAQLGGARVALFLAGSGRQRLQSVAPIAPVTFAQAHRLAPMLRCRVNGESGDFSPRAMSIRTGPTGERQRTPMPTPVCMSRLLPASGLPLSMNTAAPHGGVKERAYCTLAVSTLQAPLK